MPHYSTCPDRYVTSTGKLTCPHDQTSDNRVVI